VKLLSEEEDYKAKSPARSQEAPVWQKKKKNFSVHWQKRLKEKATEVS